MIKDIRNFLPLTENLFSSGMPTAEQMKSIAEAGSQSGDQSRAIRFRKRFEG